MLPDWYLHQNLRFVNIELLRLERASSIIFLHPPRGNCTCCFPKVLYTNAWSMGNKQDELKICVQSRGHNLVAITETWWDSSHDWNAVIEGYVLFRKDRLGKRGGGVALYVREQLECTQLQLGEGEGQVESLWVRLKGWAGGGGLLQVSRSGGSQ